MTRLEQEFMELVPMYLREISEALRDIATTLNDATRAIDKNNGGQKND